MTQQKLRVAVLDDYQGVATEMADWSGLAGAIELTAFRDHLTDPDAIARRLAPFDVLCVMRERTPLPASILTRLPNLKLIVSTGRRNVSIDMDAAVARGIAVASTGGSGNGTAELTWALILAALRHLPQETANMRAGGWQSTVGGDLQGATLGVVGLGRIGANVAEIGRAFGMKVIAWSQNLTPEKAEAAGARLVTKPELFATADIVTLHLVLSARTAGIVGDEELAGMKRTAWIINTSRGPLIDKPALLVALEGRRIAGAALDVYDVEPLPADDPLRRLPNVIATPHLGYVTRNTYETFYAETVAALGDWIRANRPELLA